MSIIGGNALDANHTISLSRLTELVPTLNNSFPNPPNMALTIRVMCSSAGEVAQANDVLTGDKCLSDCLKFVAFATSSSILYKILSLRCKARPNGEKQSHVQQTFSGRFSGVSFNSAGIGWRVLHANPTRSFCCPSRASGLGS
ncbi:MAG: hypothetical protein Q7V56_09900 [Gammaproteobacteria bacterium]|nr:hypothetical protein [Gammaproteobacteria bacterium]